MDISTQLSLGIITSQSDSETLHFVGTYFWTAVIMGFCVIYDSFILQAHCQTVCNDWLPEIIVMMKYLTKELTTEPTDFFFLKASL